MNSSPGSRCCVSASLLPSSVSAVGSVPAVPASTGVPSVVTAWMLATPSPRWPPARVSDAVTASPSTTIVWKWALMQPVSNQCCPHTENASGSNWLKWVGPSIAAPASPSLSATSPSCTLAWPSYSCSPSICRGSRTGPEIVLPSEVSGVSNAISPA